MDKQTFETFDSVEHLPLRTYNRVVMMHNIAEDFGKETLEEYIENFSETERKQIYIMQQFIRTFGVDKARQLVTKGTDDESTTVH